MNLSIEQKAEVIERFLSYGMIERASDILARQNRVEKIMTDLFGDLNMVLNNYKKLAG